MGFYGGQPHRSRTVSSHARALIHSCQSAFTHTETHTAATEQYQDRLRPQHLSHVSKTLSLSDLPSQSFQPGDQFQSVHFLKRINKTVERNLGIKEYTVNGYSDYKHRKRL